jgi:hypothetical protein
MFFPLYAVVVVVPCVFCFLKGKPVFGLIGLSGFLVPVAWVGAIRMAKPRTWWARRHYAPGGEKEQLCHERFPPETTPPLMAGEPSRFDLALGIAGLVLAAAALGMATWCLAAAGPVPEEVTVARWLLVGVVAVGMLIMAMTTVRYRMRYSPSRRGGLIVGGWIVGLVAAQLSLFAWGDAPASLAVHLSQAASAAALAGSPAFGLCAAAILLAERHEASSGGVQDDSRIPVSH